MSFHCTTKNSILRYRNLLERTNSEHVIMCSCEHCSHLQKKCRVDNEFNHCIKCVHLDCKCNLTFLMMKWKRIKAEHDHVLHELLNAHKQMQKIFAKATHLQNQFEFLKNKKQMMIERKFQNIVKLKKDERKTSKSLLNNLLFDMFFKQIEISSNFDWLSFSTKTVIEASDSSWDFSLILKCSQYVCNLFTWLINEADLWYSIDLEYSLLRIQHFDSLNQFLKISDETYLYAMLTMNLLFSYSKV